MIGSSVGLEATGNRNVLIGYGVGQNLTDDFKLIIDIENTPGPLIYGNFKNGEEVFEVNGKLTIEEVINIAAREDNPTSALKGDIYLRDDPTNPDDPTLRYFNGMIWIDL